MRERKTENNNLTGEGHEKKAMKKRKKRAREKQKK